MSTGIFGDHIVIPSLLPANLNGEIYLDLLENIGNPVLTYIVEEDERYCEEKVIIQQDGTSPHYVMPVRQLLDDTFPE